MEGFKEFIKEYCGAIIGALVAIIILCTNLYKLILPISFFASPSLNAFAVFSLTVPHSKLSTHGSDLLLFLC